MSKSTTNKASVATLNNVVAREGAIAIAQDSAANSANGNITASSSNAAIPTTIAQCATTPKRKTKRVYIRNRIIHLYGRINSKTYRVTTGKEATKENIKWAEANWERVLRRAVRKKEAKEAAKRKAEREATKALRESVAKSLSASQSIMPSGASKISDYGIEAIRMKAKARKGKTNAQYEYVFATEIIPAFGDLRLDEIRAFHIKRWQRDLLEEGLSTLTIKRYRSVLSLILKEAITDEIIDRNPLSIELAPAGRAKEKKPFTMDDIRLMLSIEKDGWFRDYLIIAFFTGLRIGEAFALEWRHIDFKDKIIYVMQAISGGVIGTPKTPSSIRTIDMLPIVEQALRRQFGRTGKLDSFIFLNKYNRVFKDRSYIRKMMWRPLLEQCGLEYREFYSTRHTFASLMLSQSEEPMWVSAMLGHKNLAITLSVYAKYIPRRNILRAQFLNNCDFGSSDDLLTQAA
jgi:integrase